MQKQDIYIIYLITIPSYAVDTVQYFFARCLNTPEKMETIRLTKSKKFASYILAAGKARIQNLVKNTSWLELTIKLRQ